MGEKTCNKLAGEVRRGLKCDLNEAVNKLIQYYRHDFLNILQMVSGLAQLQKTDRLMTYIRKVTDEVQQFGRFIGWVTPVLPCCFMKDCCMIWTENMLSGLTGFYRFWHKILFWLWSGFSYSEHRPGNLPDFTLHVYIQGGQAPALHLLLSRKHRLMICGSRSSS